MHDISGDVLYILVHMIVISRAIVREAENPRSLRTGNDLILAVSHRRDVEAVSIATYNTVCIDRYYYCCELVVSFGIMSGMGPVVQLGQV